MAGFLSRTQVDQSMITQLCQEIRDMKKAKPMRNNIEVLPVVPNNTPDQSGSYGKGGRDDAATDDSTLRPVLPNDNPDSPARRDSSPPPFLPEPPQTLPEPRATRAHLDVGQRIYALACATSDEGPEDEPAASSMASSSPSGTGPEPSSSRL
jgi:hypothetical protein